MSYLFTKELADRLEQFHIEEDEEIALTPRELCTIFEMSPTPIEAIYNAYKLGIIKGAGARQNPPRDRGNSTSGNV